MIRLTINNKVEFINSEKLYLSELVALKNIPLKGTAVAVNGKIARKENWDTTKISAGDSLTVISAAYGG